MEITGKITGIKYSVKNAEKLQEIPINDFDINSSPASFLLKNNNNSLAVSKWVSPKRTRSYPIDNVKKSYLEIEKNIGVKLHNFDGLDNFQKKIGKDVEKFIEFSREKAQKAQNREINTIQPKENLQTLTKAKITITNYLGGQYFFTVDEIEISENTIYLIESKHSQNSILPSKGDIKDGLLKMILYSNLCEVEVDGVKMKIKAVLKLTSKRIVGEINQNCFGSERAEFIFANNLDGNKQYLISEIFKEAQENGFEVRIGGVI